MRSLATLSASLLLAPASLFAGDGADSPLAAPFTAEAGGRPIDLANGIGHAAPLFMDWDGDGLKDLLVGQFDGGYLRIYRNTGKKGAPTFGEHTWFEADGARAKVETG